MSGWSPPRVARHDPERVHVTCACGATYSLDGWRALRVVGEHVDAEARLELRDCACGSTFGVATPRVRVVYSVEPSPRGKGWVVWRRAGGGDWRAVGVGARATVCITRQGAEALVERSRINDRGAATLLGVELVEGVGR